MNKIGGITAKHAPRILEVTACAYARELTVEKFQALITFAQTPAGEHLLELSSPVGNDDEIADAYIAYGKELEDPMNSLSRIMCQHATQARIAAGDTNEKCTLE